MSCEERIRQHALDLGFDAVGIAPARRAPHAAAFFQWLEEGCAAGMAWMARDPERRADPRKVLPGARSAVVVGLSYFVEEPPSELWDDPLRGRIARYAWGRDYHDEIEPLLRELARAIRAEAGGTTRIFVDTAPVLERAAAVQAGLGFVGLNSNLIHPRWGSYLFLGGVLTQAALEPDMPSGGTCGRCRRCLEACPMDALTQPRRVDARRCAAYLTVEHRGAIPLELRPRLKRWVFGCDACQEVCPFVQRLRQPSCARFLRFDADTCAPRLADLLEMDEASFQNRFGSTPVSRTRLRGLRRSAAIVAGNSGRPELIPALEKAADDPDPLVREHAGWALARLRGAGGPPQ